MVRIPHWELKHYDGQRWWFQMIRRDGRQLKRKDGLADDKIYGPFPSSKAAEAALNQALSKKWLAYGEGYVVTKDQNGKWIVAVATDGVMHPGLRSGTDLVPIAP
jgi:hypothetical protein